VLDGSVAVADEPDEVQPATSAARVTAANAVWPFNLTVPKVRRSRAQGPDCRRVCAAALHGGVCSAWRGLDGGYLKVVAVTWVMWIALRDNRTAANV
jgi:hypothetical protein